MSLHPFRTQERKERIRETLSRRRLDLTLVLANIHDPHNVSAILRSCDAFGVMQVHLYYTDTAFPILGRKSSASAKKWVDCLRHSDAKAMVAELVKNNGQIVSAGFDETAAALHEVDFTRPTAVVMGNEHEGPPPELAALVPRQVYIPMMGMVQSFNVSVAAALILYEATRQRMSAGGFEETDMSAEELEKRFVEWCNK